MVLANFSSVWPVQHSCGCFWIIVAGSIWLLKIFTVFDASGLFWRIGVGTGPICGLLF